LIEQSLQIHSQRLRRKKDFMWLTPRAEIRNKFVKFQPLPQIYHATLDKLPNLSS